MFHEFAFLSNLWFCLIFGRSCIFRHSYVCPNIDYHCSDSDSDSDFGYLVLYGSTL